MGGLVILVNFGRIGGPGGDPGELIFYVFLLTHTIPRVPYYEQFNLSISSDSETPQLGTL